MSEKIAELKEMLLLVDEAQQILEGNGALDAFGELLDHTWKLKRRTGANVSTGAIDSYYEKAMAAGALGGKLLGAGGGGFLLFYVPEEAEENVRKAMEGLLEIPFAFENTGTSVIYESTETYSFREG